MTDWAISYQRFLTPNFKPFNPIKFSRETERIVTREGQERKYVGIYSEPAGQGIFWRGLVDSLLREGLRHLKVKK